MLSIECYINISLYFLANVSFFFLKMTNTNFEIKSFVSGSLGGKADFI